MIIIICKSFYKFKYYVLQIYTLKIQLITWIKTCFQDKLIPFNLVKQVGNWLDQTSANRGPDSRFVLVAILKTMIDDDNHKSCTHKSWFLAWLELAWIPKFSHMLTRILTHHERNRNCKSRLWMCKLEYSNKWPLFGVVFDLEYRLISKLFLIPIPSRVICQSLD